MFNIRSKITKLLYNLPYKLKNIILFESNPDYCDNTRGVFDRLLELGYNEKNKLVWFVSDKQKFNDIKIKNVIFIDDKDVNKRKYYHHFAKYIIDCNKFIYKLNKNQFRIHLTHGTPIKFAGGYCALCGKTDYVVQVSDYFTEITMDLFKVSKKEVISVGFPRNDILLKKNNCIFFPELKRKKTICWFPTYRNHKSSSTGINYFPYGIPSVNSESELKKLNEFLKKENVLLVIKLHPAEDASILQKFNFEYIKLIEDKLFDIDHTSLYHYLSNVDALITDYSSVYYDFLLTKKPIGLAICDIKEYSKKTRLIFDNYEENVAGEYIYNFDDILTFVHNVSTNNDISFKKRMEKIPIYHKYTDDKSSDRIIALLEKKGLKK